MVHHPLEALFPFGARKAHRLRKVLGDGAGQNDLETAATTEPRVGKEEVAAAGRPAHRQIISRRFQVIDCAGDPICRGGNLLGGEPWGGPILPVDHVTAEQHRLTARGGCHRVIVPAAWGLSLESPVRDCRCGRRAVGAKPPEVGRRGEPPVPVSVTMCFDEVTRVLDALENADAAIGSRAAGVWSCLGEVRPCNNRDLGLAIAPPIRPRSAHLIAAGCRTCSADGGHMSYGWWKFIHLVGVVGFVAAHGTSMAATVLMRRIHEPRAGVRDSPAERGHGERLLCLDPGAPGRRVRCGVRGHRFDQGWIWLSLGVLVGVGILMFPMAGGISAASGWCSS